MVSVVVAIGVPLLLLVIGYFAGSAAERNHLRDLDEREARTAGVLATDLGRYAADLDPSATPQLVVTEVVIASDYMKNLLGGLRNIFGGQVTAYVTLANRARREALLRLKQEAGSQGLNALCNVRLETADVGGSGGGRGMVMAAILASATAYRRSGGDAPGPGMAGGVGA